MRSHFLRPITDQTGSPVRNVQVFVAQPTSDNTGIAQPLFVDGASSQVLPNPFPVNNGVIEFYVDQPQSVTLVLTTPSSSYTVRDLDILPPSEQIVTSPTGLSITNSPMEGQFLKAQDQNSASWVYANEIATTQPTPLQTVAAFSSVNASTLLFATDSNGRAINSTMVPMGTGLGIYPDQLPFTWAVGASGTSSITYSTRSQILPESGYAAWVYQIRAKNSAGAPTLSFAVDGIDRRVDSPISSDYLNKWCIGYFGDITPGTNVGKLTYLPGTDPTAAILIGGLYLFSGDNIPFHTHVGAGPSSTLLGPGATAPYQGDTVVGAQALSKDAYGTSVGSHAQSDFEGTAVGAYSYAASYGSVLGYYATNYATTKYGTAIGYYANTQADNAIALGAQSTASGAGSVAIGKSATAAGDRSLAIGVQAQAHAPDSVALGAGAYVDPNHAGSYAIGANTLTTAPNQISVGDTFSSVFVNGALSVTKNAIIGGQSSTLGFYGSPGTTRPVIYGDVQGNDVVRNIVLSLKLLGLIDDQTTDSTQKMQS